MSVRREARLRREYIFRKSLQPKYRSEYRQKKRIQKSLNDGEIIPDTLQSKFDSLNNEIKFDDIITSTKGGQRKTKFIDDEYGNAGIKDPKVIITTSHNPSNKLLRFVKEMKLCFPNSIRVNRGNINIKELVLTCKNTGFTDLIIFHEHKGICDGMIINHLPYGPTCYFSINDVIARHDLPKKSLNNLSEQIPHLIFNNFTTLLGKRVTNIIKYCYPIMDIQKKDKIRRVISFTNINDFIVFRHHIYKTINGNKDVELKEVGPRFTLRLYQIKLGTVDQKNAPIEWVLRPYFNTAWKRKAL